MKRDADSEWNACDRPSGVFLNGLNEGISLRFDAGPYRAFRGDPHVMKISRLTISWYSSTNVMHRFIGTPYCSLRNRTLCFYWQIEYDNYIDYPMSRFLHLYSMRNGIFGTLCCILFMACQNKVQVKNDIPVIDGMTQKKATVSELFPEIGVVPLQTSDSSLIQA